MYPRTLAVGFPTLVRPFAAEQDQRWKGMNSSLPVKLGVGPRHGEAGVVRRIVDSQTAFWLVDDRMLDAALQAFWFPPAAIGRDQQRAKPDRIAHQYL